MKALLSCAEAAALDAAAGEAIPHLLLMEDASLRMWQALAPLAAERGAGQIRALVAVCGSGDNGGDALALLRHARSSGLANLAAVLAKEPGERAQVHAASLRALGVPLYRWADDEGACLGLLEEASLIVDGLTGTGMRGPLRGELASIVQAVNETARRVAAAVAAIDLPSGLSDSYAAGSPAIEASWTLSVEPRKLCLYTPAARESVGKIVPIEGVFPADLQAQAESKARIALIEEADLSALDEEPSAAAYKGSRGRLAVFAGAPGSSGAAALASKAALASGAGLAALFASKPLFPIVAPMLEAVMVKREPEDFGEFDASDFDPRAWDALLVGPGWGREESRLRALDCLLSTGLPAVLDADAIRLYRSLLDRGFKPVSRIVLTPHPGEFEALAGVAARDALANPATILRRTAMELQATIILKSHVTWIAGSSGELAVFDGRECGLGTAGSGDVLAGLAGGILARRAASGPLGQTESFAAAQAAVLAHGMAGRRARRGRGWFDASGLIEEAAIILGSPRS